MTDPPRRPADRTGAPRAASRLVIPALVVIFGLAGVIMLAIIIEARNSRLPDEVLLPVDEQDIRWVAPTAGDAAAASDGRGDGR